MTNADKIRAMSDEELAAWLAKTLSSGREWFDARSCNLCKAKNAGRCPTGENATCLVPAGSEIMEYLQSPADE